MGASYYLQKLVGPQIAFRLLLVSLFKLATVLTLGTTRQAS